jgi:ribonuclease VapC
VSSSVLDASALLALLNREVGHERVTQVIADGAAISAVNLSEVVAKLAERGAAEDEIREALNSLRLEVLEFHAEFAYHTGLLRPLTRQAGLSLGDRACLALARALGLPVITAEREWASLQLGITIRVIR